MEYHLIMALLALTATCAAYVVKQLYNIAEDIYYRFKDNDQCFRHNTKCKECLKGFKKKSKKKKK